MIGASSTTLPCRHHVEEFYTNYCCSLNCRTPLCPDCIDDHNKHHKTKGTHPEIDTLKRVKVMCDKKLNLMIQMLSNNLAQLERYKNMSPEDLIIEAKKEMEDSRRKMIQVIDNYFEQMLSEYSSQIRANIGKAFDFNELIKELTSVVIELKRIDDNLDSHDTLFDSIDRTIKTSSDDLLNHYNSETARRLDTCLSLKLPMKFVDSEADNFRQDVAKYVRVVQKKIGIPKEAQEISIRLHNSVNNTEVDSYFKSKFKE